jgi:hypothetical protein
MRYLLCTVLALAACERRDTARDVSAADTSVLGDTADRDTTGPGTTMTALPDRLLGSWKAQGYDAGSSRAQPFTITWTRAPDGSLAGKIAFEGGEQYDVKVVSTTDTMIVYESAPHRSPTLKARVVTRTRARMVGDTLVGSYTARAGKGGKALSGTFRATRG